MLNKKIIVTIAILFHIKAICQSQENKFNYAYPMQPPIDLAGSFGELRSTRFHTGIDIRVIGRNDRNVYSIADGYISRIKIEPGGFGKALYITHPDGHTSVYAHLDRFSNELNKYVKKLQYEKQTFSIDTTLSPDIFPVSKGKFIGIAGNTGYSFGPHLHFEIRNTHTQKPIDPLLFGYKINDNFYPEFTNLKIYTHGNALIDGKNTNLMLTPSKISHKDYKITNPIKAVGYLSFGFGIIDKQSLKNTNKLGIKTLQCYVNEKLFFNVHFDTLDFKTNKNLIAYVDLKERNKSKRDIQRTYLMPNNKSPIYKFIDSQGIIKIEKDSIYDFTCIATDFNNNSSKLQFKIKGDTVSINPQIDSVCQAKQIKVRYDSTFVYKNNFYEIVIPAYSLFDNACISIKEVSTQHNTLSKSIQITSEVPLLNPIILRLKPTQSNLKDYNVFIASLNGNKMRVLKTNNMVQWFETELLSYGTFALVDVKSKPQIKPVNIPANGIVTNNKTLSFLILDETCEITSYNGYINDKWVLFEYDLKNNSLFYEIDENMPKGKSKLKVVVENMCGNSSIWEKEIVY